VTGADTVTNTLTTKYGEVCNYSYDMPYNGMPTSGAVFTARALDKAGNFSLYSGSFVLNGRPVKPLYRFYDAKLGVHFYTAEDGEKNTIIATNPRWKYEGIAYYVVKSDGGCQDYNATPVYRFYAAAQGYHFYTANIEERDYIIANDHRWTYEGRVFCTYTGSNGSWASSVYRFYRPRTGNHFYTISEAEKNAILASDPSWKYEIVAYKAIPQ
jgi:hypothetical protein